MAAERSRIESGKELKVLLFSNTDWNLFNFRRGLADTLRAIGHEVVMMSPPGPYVERLRSAGYRLIEFPFSRHGLNAFADLRVLLRLVTVYRRERPDLVHHYTIKCVLYGSIAARWSSIPVIVNTVSGLGTVFIDNKWTARLIRPFVRQLYRWALRGTRVIFQNQSDMQSFLEHHMVAHKMAHLVKGSGVNVGRFAPWRVAVSHRRKQVLFSGRLIRAKGVVEFVDAAREVSKNLPQVRFLVAGERDPNNPDNIPDTILSRWKEEGCVEFLGHRDNMSEVLKQADLVVLPSHREGLPKSLLEAAACGLPLVATDVPGCREVVRHEINGMLVPVRDTRALAQAIQTLLEDDTRRIQMGLRSREIACSEFSEEQVIGKILAVYGLGGMGRSVAGWQVQNPD